MQKPLEDKLISVALPGTAWLRMVNQLILSEVELLQESYAPPSAAELEDRRPRCRVLWLLLRAAADGSPGTHDAGVAETRRLLDALYRRVEYDPVQDEETLDGLKVCALRVADVESLWSKMREAKRIWDELPAFIRERLERRNA